MPARCSLFDGGPDNREPTQTRRAGDDGAPRATGRGNFTGFLDYEITAELETLGNSGQGAQIGGAACSGCSNCRKSSANGLFTALAVLALLAIFSDKRRPL